MAINGGCVVVVDLAKLFNSIQLSFIMRMVNQKAESQALAVTVGGWRGRCKRMHG